MDLDKVKRVLDGQINISIAGNKNTTIHNNTIEIVLPDNNVSSDYYSRIDFQSMGLRQKDLQDLYEESKFVTSVFEVESLLVQKLDMTRDLYKKTRDTVMVRFWGMYSGFSNIRSFYDNSEIGTLEREKKRHLLDLVQKRFPVRMILTLNIQRVLDFGFSLDQIQQRIEDMCAVCRDLKKYDNFQIPNG